MTEWKLCKDSTPVTGELCIVTIKDDAGDRAYFYTTAGWYIEQMDAWVIDNDLYYNVIAWMPFPRPCKDTWIECAKCNHLEFKWCYGICGKTGDIKNSCDGCYNGDKK